MAYRTREARSARTLPLAALVTLSAAACTGTPAGDPPGGARALVPLSAHVVARVDFARLRKTPFWPGFVRTAAADVRLAEYLEAPSPASGWDPLAGLDSATVAVGLGGGDPGVVALLSGSIDPERTLAWVRRRAEAIDWALPPLVPTRHHGVRMYDDPWRGSTYECVFFGRSVVAIGAVGSARQAIDVFERREPAALDGPGAAFLLPDRPAPPLLTIRALFDDRDRVVVGPIVGGAAVADASLDLDVESGLDLHVRVSGVSDDDGAKIELVLMELMAGLRRDAALTAAGVSALLEPSVIARNGRVVDAAIRVDAARAEGIVGRFAQAAARVGPVHPETPF